MFNDPERAEERTGEMGYEFTDTLTPYTVKVNGSTAAQFSSYEDAIGFVKAKMRVDNIIEITWRP